MANGQNVGAWGVRLVLIRLWDPETFRRWLLAQGLGCGELEVRGPCCLAPPIRENYEAETYSLRLRMDLAYIDVQTPKLEEVFIVRSQKFKIWIPKSLVLTGEWKICCLSDKLRVPRLNIG